MAYNADLAFYLQKLWEDQKQLGYIMVKCLCVLLVYSILPLSHFLFIISRDESDDSEEAGKR